MAAEEIGKMYVTLKIRGEKEMKAAVQKQKMAFERTRDAAIKNDKRMSASAKKEALKIRRAHEKAHQKIRDNIKMTGLAFVALAAAGTAAIIKLTQKASILEETTAKFETVFADQIPIAEKWSDTLVKSYGVSTEQAKRFLGSIQDLLVPMGMESTAAGKLSNEIVKLSVDMGSFNNLPTEKVMLDIQSALVGNFETMKKYGVVLNATRVEQHIMNEGWVTSKKDITQAMKAQAAYELIVKGSEAAVGDFNRTSDGYANKVKIMEARIEDLQAELGMIFIPMMKELVDIVVDDILPAFSDWLTSIGGAEVAAKWFSGRLRDIVNVSKLLIQTIDVLGDGIVGTALVMSGRFSAAKEAFISMTAKFKKFITTSIDLSVKDTKAAVDGEREKASATKKSARERIKSQERIRASNDALIAAAAENAKKEIESFNTILQNKILLRQIDLDDAITTINKELDAETLSNEKRKLLEESLTKFKKKEEDTRIKDAAAFFNSIEGKFERNIETMIHGTENFSNSVQGMLDAVGATAVQMIAKEAAVWITAQIAKATAGALAAHSGIPFVGIGLGLAAAAVITSEINKARDKARVPGLAQGGLAFKPTLAVVGDNTQAAVDPEVIAPLSKLREMLVGTGDQTIILNVSGKQLMRAVVKRMPKEMRRIGATI